MLKNRQFNFIFDEFYKIIQNMDDSEILEFFSNIEMNINRDFKMMFKTGNEIDNTKTIQIIQLYIENVLFSTIGVRKKAFYKYIENKCKIEKLENDRLIYHSIYLDIVRELKYKICYTFEKYYEVAISVKSQDEIRIMYATYLSIIYYIINTMPDSYIEEIKKNEEFKLLKAIDFILGEPNVLYIKRINDTIRDYIKEKYSIDIYDCDINEDKKVLSRNVFKTLN